MPVRSKAQWRFLAAKRPDLLSRFQHESPVKYGKLPSKRKGKKKVAKADPAYEAWLAAHGLGPVAKIAVLQVGELAPNEVLAPPRKRKKRRGRKHVPPADPS